MAATRQRAFGLAWSFVAEPPTHEADWSDYATWIFSAEVPKAPLLPLRPVLGDIQLQTHDALKLLREQLLFKKFYEIFEA